MIHSLLLRHFLLRLAVLTSLLAGASGQAMAAPQKVISIEGVTEYRLNNGLRVLLVPDPSVDTVIVHLTYLVGSRHEGYGEKGMAHLLEHMLFKGTSGHPRVKEEFVRRGARYNGTTSYDRTNYFETLAATDSNLDWALAMEADRMVNAHIRKEDLDSEMTVVRNEFESGENSPGNVLRQRMTQLAFTWHNYGRPVIGARSDIENVPIERLQAFYRTYYQPDNAVLTLGGRFDAARALEMIEKHFGPIPRPTRKLPQLHTSEPTQDGERSVTLRRVGDSQIVAALYRVPAASHPDYPAVDALVHILSSPPTGRLHRALVQTGLASTVWGAERSLHDPGFMYFGAGLLKDAPLEPARAALLEVLEAIGRAPVQEDETERAKLTLLNELDKVQTESHTLVNTLSEFIAMGDWRLFYLYRDRLRAVTAADVQRVATTYFTPANRVLGTFIPTAQPVRAEIPPGVDLAQALAGYSGGKAPELGEAFDPTPDNIERRLVRKTLQNGIRVTLLPKKTRGGNVVASLTLRWGDEASKANRNTACSLAGSMLMRGTRSLSRAELKDAFEALKANVSISGDGASIDTQRAQLVDALRLVAQVLREPAFPASEFAELKLAALARTESQLSDPGAIATESIARYLAPYPKGHWLYTPSMQERLDELKKVDLAESRRCYEELFGATRAEFAAIGDFDPAQVMTLLEELFGDWKSPRPYVRIPARFFDRPGTQSEIRAPDKANAVLRAGLNLKMRDDHPDFAALVLGNYLLGGASTARLPGRIREKDGLSYSTYSTFSASQLDEVARFSASAIFAPQNKGRVEAALREEIVRALRDGFTDEEIASGKTGLLQARRLARTQDRTLLARLSLYLSVERTFAWDIDFEGRIASLTRSEVRDAMRRHLDPAALAVVKVGDFKE